MTVAGVGGGGWGAQVQVSSITWVQHVSLTSRTYIYHPCLMTFFPNLVSFHSKPLWSVICILAPTGWNIIWMRFFFYFSISLLSFMHLLTHSFTIPEACYPPDSLPTAQDLLLISSLPPKRNKQIGLQEEQVSVSHLDVIFGENHWSWTITSDSNNVGGKVDKWSMDIFK